MSARALRLLAPLGLAVAVAILFACGERPSNNASSIARSTPAPAPSTGVPARVATPIQAVKAAASQANEQPVPVLAAVAGQPAAQKPASTRLVKRQRLVALDRAAFEDFLARGAKDPTQELLLPLFPDRVCTVRNLHLAARERSAAGYTAELKEAPHGRVQFVYNDGALLATVDLGDGGLFAIESDPSGAQVVRELDRAAFLPCGAEGAQEIACRAPAGTAHAARSAAPRGGTPQLDVLVLYTSDVAQAQGGGASGMQDFALSAILSTNVSLSESLTGARANLVAAVQVDYAETGDLYTDIARLKDGSDGFLDQAQALREQYAADLVCLLVESGNASGIGYLLTSPSGSPDFGYSVVMRSAAVYNLSFAHELGHNLGCHHDREHATSGYLACSYGYRFFGTDGVQYRTVMSYSPGQRIPRYSNPDVSYAGSPTGVADGQSGSADNAKTIRATAGIVSQYSAMVLSQPDLEIASISSTPSEPVPGQPMTFTVTVRNSGFGSAAPFRLGFWPHRASAPGASTEPAYSQQSAALSAGTARSFDFSVIAPPAGQYTAWAFADEGSGAGDVLESEESNNSNEGGFAWSVTGNGPPQILSGPTASPATAQIGQEISFAVAASDPESDAMSVTWTFGDGTAGSGESVTHAYAAGGTFQATASVSDGQGNVTNGTVTVRVVDNVPLVGEGIDTDFDDFSDEFEALAGTDPQDASDTPYGSDPATELQDLALDRLQIKLVFSSSGKDALQVKGRLPVPEGFNANGQYATLMVGGVARRFTLQANGPDAAAKGAAPGGTIKVGSVKGGAAMFSAALKKGAFAGTLAASSNLDNADVVKEARSVEVIVLYGGAAFRTVQPVLYTAKQDKGGKAK